jgi:hypothetical protein
MTCVEEDCGGGALRGFQNVGGVHYPRLRMDWTEKSDEELVEQSGLAGFRGGGSYPSPAGFQAQAELSRRLAVELRLTRDELARSGKVMIRLTRALVGLTILLAILTVILLFQEP